MNRFVLLVFAAFAALFAHAQDTVYVYNHLDKISGPEHRKYARYYCLAQNSEGPFAGQVKFYDLEGKLHAEVAFNAEGKKDGLTAFYFKDGGRDEEFTYQEGAIAGPYKKWYRNGQLQEEGTALAPAVTGENPEYLLLQYWDSLGNHLLKDGNGELVLLHKNGAVESKGLYQDGRKTGKWFGYLADGTPYYEEVYQQGKLLEGSSSIKGQNYRYKLLEEEAMPVIDMQSLYGSLYKDIKYPKAAIMRKMQGTVYVRFIIDETGKVESAESVEGREVGYGMDEEAIRVLLLTQWKPAKHRGIPVKQEKILPIKFRIQ